MDQVLDTLIRGRDIFAERGGAKGMIRDYDDKVCVRGALLTVLGAEMPQGSHSPDYMPDEAREIFYEADSYLAKALGWDGVGGRNSYGASLCYNPAAFNNHDDTSTDHVLALMEGAITLRERELVNA